MCIRDKPKRAAKLSRAARVRQELVTFDPDRVLGLDQLDRHVGEIADAIGPGVLAIRGRSAAIAGVVVELEVQEAPPGLVVSGGGDGELRPAGTCGKPPRHQGRQSAEHDRAHTKADLPARSDGGWIFDAHEGAFRCHHLDRPIEAGIVGNLGRQHRPDGGIGAGDGEGPIAMHRTPGVLLGSGEVGRDLVAAFGEREVEADRTVADAVVIVPLRELHFAVRQGRDARARELLAVVDEIGEVRGEFIAPPRPRYLLDLGSGLVQRRELRPQVAEHALGDA